MGGSYNCSKRRKAIQVPKLEIPTLAFEQLRKKIRDKELSRAKASIDQRPKPILLIELPESAKIYEEGMVWEEKQVSRISLPPSKGILKVGFRRTTKKIPKTGNISFAQEHHVRYYHCPNLLKKCKPVKQRSSESTKKSIVTKYVGALHAFNHLVKELRDTNGLVRVSDTKLSQELLHTTLLLTGSMDTELFQNFVNLNSAKIHAVLH